MHHTQTPPSIPAERRTREALHAFFLCIILPSTLNFFAYYGFVTNYSRFVFSRSGFLEQFESGIYRYRVLGRWLLLFVHRVITHFHPVSGASNRLTQFLETSDINFYHSYFLLNTFFLCLTIATLYLIFRLPAFDVKAREADPWLMIVAFLIVLTQFVILPYDTLSYFLLCLSAYMMLHPKTGWTLPALTVIVVLAALTRETAALTLALYAALYTRRQAVPCAVTLPGLGLLIGSFVATYVGLRMAYGWNHGVGDGILLFHNLEPRALVGMGFLVTLGVLVFGQAPVSRRRTLVAFLLFSAPYLFSIVVTGYLFEVRLGVPILIGMIVLAHLRHVSESTQDRAAISHD